MRRSKLLPPSLARSFVGLLALFPGFFLLQSDADNALADQTGISEPAACEQPPKDLAHVFLVAKTEDVHTGGQRIGEFIGLHRELVKDTKCYPNDIKGLTTAQKDALLWDRVGDTLVAEEDIIKDFCAVQHLDTLPGKLCLSEEHQPAFDKSLDDCTKLIAAQMQRTWQNGRRLPLSGNDMTTACPPPNQGNLCGKNGIDPSGPYVLQAAADQQSFRVQDPYYGAWLVKSGNVGAQALRDNLPRYKVWNGTKWSDANKEQMDAALTNNLYVANPGTDAGQQSPDLLVPKDTKAIPVGTVVDIANVDPLYVPAQFSGDNMTSARMAILGLLFGAAVNNSSYSDVVAQNFAAEMVSRAWKKSNSWKIDIKNPANKQYLESAEYREQFRSYLTLSQLERIRDQYVVKGAAECVASSNGALAFPTRPTTRAHVWNFLVFKNDKKHCPHK